MISIINGHCLVIFRNEPSGYSSLSATCVYTSLWVITRPDTEPPLRDRDANPIPGVDPVPGDHLTVPDPLATVEEQVDSANEEAPIAKAEAKVARAEQNPYHSLNLRSCYFIY